MNALGTHTLIDYYECDPQILSSVAQIRDILLSAIQISGLTIVLDTFHHFEPHGVSGVVVISESHVTIHTWPEHSYAALDVFTCGDAMQSEVIHSEIQNGLKSTRVSAKHVIRGIMSNQKSLMSK